MNTMLINPLTGKDIWVHSTPFDDPQNWVNIDVNKNNPNANNKNKFYIGAGDNLLEFGYTTVFVKYKPTKLFNANFSYFGGTYEEAKRFLDCVYSELLKLDDESKESFLLNYFDDVEEECVDEDSDWGWDDSSIDDSTDSEEAKDLLGFGLCDKADIEDAIINRLETLSYAFYEDPFIQHCLVSLGYTGYIECEKYFYDYEVDFYDPPDPMEINVAIFESDFDNVEIVGVLNAFNIDDKAYYQCPRCKDLEAINVNKSDWRTLGADLVLNILESGKFECRKCSEG